MAITTCGEAATGLRTPHLSGQRRVNGNVHPESGRPVHGSSLHDTLTSVCVTYIVHMPRKELNDHHFKSRGREKSVAAEGTVCAKAPRRESCRYPRGTEGHCQNQVRQTGKGLSTGLGAPRCLEKVCKSFSGSLLPITAAHQSPRWATGQARGRGPLRKLVLVGGQLALSEPGGLFQATRLWLPVRGTRWPAGLRGTGEF